MKIRILSAGLALGLTFLSSTPADAQLRFCNRSDVTVVIAVGYHIQEHWFNAGWYQAAPNECIAPGVLDHPLRNRTYAWFARQRDGGGLVWEGEHFACLPNTPFQGPWRGVCRSGETAEGFRLIEVPQGQTIHVQNLDGVGGAPVRISNAMQTLRYGWVSLDGDLRQNGRLSYSARIVSTSPRAANRARVSFELLDASGRLLYTTSEQRLPTACATLDPTCQSEVRHNSHIDVPAHIARQARRVRADIRTR